MSGVPDPDYNDDGKRKSVISFQRIERDLTSELGLLTGEEIADAEVKDGRIVFELEQTD